MSFGEKFLDMIDQMMANSVSKAEYDKTIQAQIISCEDATIGKYKCRYQDAIIYAYANSADITYTKDAYVYILVPGSDMKKDKTILGTTEKLGINYLSAAQGDQIYNLIGQNCITNNDKFYLDVDINYYTYDIYNVNNTENDIQIDVASLQEYLKKAQSIRISADFKTNIPVEQRNGDYGISFEIVFLDNATNEENTTIYTLSQNDMVGMPYNFVNKTSQFKYFNIKGQFVRINKVTIFNRNFPNSIGESHEKLTDGEIEISNINFFGAARLTEEEANGVAITFSTPQGSFFDGNATSASYKTIVAQVKIKGKPVSADQNIPFYWGYESTKIKAGDKYYNKYLGSGWKCLNDYNVITTSPETIEWSPNKNSYVVNFGAAPAKNNIFKVVIVYEKKVYSKEINIQNLKSGIDCWIQSSDGEQFYHDIGHPTLCFKATFNGTEFNPANYMLVWSYISSANNVFQLAETTTENYQYATLVSDLATLQAEIAAGTKFKNAEADNIALLKTQIAEYDNIQRVYQNYIYNVQIKNLTLYGIFKCSIYSLDGETCYGTASIKLTNLLENEGSYYALVINNGEVAFQYNEYGIAPTNSRLTSPQVLSPLTFVLYNNLGQPIDNQVLANENNCKIRWAFPKNDTLLIDTNENPTQEDNDYKYYDNLTITYNIADGYDLRKTNNQVALRVDYNGTSFSTQTKFAFSKQGEPGTNGTEYMVKIVPNTKMTNPPQYPMLTSVNGQYYKLNYGLESTDAETLVQNSYYGRRYLKAQLWKSGQLLWEGTSPTDGNFPGQEVYNPDPLTDLIPLATIGPNDYETYIQQFYPSDYTFGKFMEQVLKAVVAQYVTISPETSAQTTLTNLIDTINGSSQNGFVDYFENFYVDKNNGKIVGWQVENHAKSAFFTLLDSVLKQTKTVKNAPAGWYRMASYSDGMDDFRYEYSRYAHQGAFKGGFLIQLKSTGRTSYGSYFGIDNNNVWYIATFEGTGTQIVSLFKPGSDPYSGTLYSTSSNSYIFNDGNMTPSINWTFNGSEWAQNVNVNQLAPVKLSSTDIQTNFANLYGASDTTALVWNGVGFYRTNVNYDIIIYPSGVTNTNYQYNRLMSDYYMMYMDSYDITSEIDNSGYLMANRGNDSTNSPIVWSIIQNKYRNNLSDNTCFQIDDAVNGLFHINWVSVSYSFKIPAVANIIQCAINWEGKTYYGSIPFCTAWVKNENYRLSLKDGTGFHYALYTSDGMSPQYDAEHPFEFICEQKINGIWEDVSTVAGSHEITYNSDQNGWINVNGWIDVNALQKQPHTSDLAANQFRYRPISRYTGECVTNAIICQYSQNGEVIGRLHTPIHLLLNRYGLSHINAWDGNSIELNHDGGYILAPQMGAGVKDNNNNFTGVIMGEVREAGKDYYDVGLAGYAAGLRSFFLNAKDGSAVFGVHRSAQIVIDPNVEQGGMIYGGDFWKTYQANSYLPSSYVYRNDAFQPYGNNKNVDDPNIGGMIINFSIPEIYFANGKFWVNKLGVMHCETGNIGGWTVDTDGISAGDITLNSEGSITGPNWSITDTGQANFTYINLNASQATIDGQSIQNFVRGNSLDVIQPISSSASPIADGGNQNILTFAFNCADATSTRVIAHAMINFTIATAYQNGYNDCTLTVSYILDNTTIDTQTSTYRDGTHILTLDKIVRNLTVGNHVLVINLAVAGGSLS